MRIVSGPPPTLKPDTPASAPFHNFISRALIKEPASRPSAKELLADPFVATADPAALASVLCEPQVVAAAEAAAAEAGEGATVEVAPLADEGGTLVLTAERI